MTGSAAALVSFEESSGLLHELAGVEVSSSQVERAAALGAEIAADERACLEKMGEVAPTMYLGLDGTGVPMRTSVVAGRAGKQPVLDTSPDRSHFAERVLREATLRGLYRGSTLRGAGGRFCLDLEHRHGTVPSGHSDSRSFPR